MKAWGGHRIFSFRLLRRSDGHERTAFQAREWECPAPRPNERLGDAKLDQRSAQRSFQPWRQSTRVDDADRRACCVSHSIRSLRRSSTSGSGGTVEDISVFPSATSMGRWEGREQKSKWARMLQSKRPELTPLRHWTQNLCIRNVSPRLHCCRALRRGQIVHAPTGSPAHDLLPLFAPHDSGRPN